MHKSEISQKIKRKAQELGFLSCGISKVDFLSEDAPRLENWLKESRHGKMSYMENYFDLRLNPALLVPGSKSVISVLENYFPNSDLYIDRQYKISKYAYGEDYHTVLKSKLNLLLKYIVNTFGSIEGRCFTDSAPILERAWAKKSGLGWIGKNGNLITQSVGSFYFLGEIILDLELDYDNPASEHCGTCTACIDACPTEAIIKPNSIDGSKCISYLTIELKDELIQQDFSGKMNGWVFGCDICQDVCPWNRFAKPHNEIAFQPEIILSDDELKNLSEEFFNKAFAKSPIKRTKYTGLKRNIQFIDISKK